MLRRRALHLRRLTVLPRDIPSLEPDERSGVRRRPRPRPRARSWRDRLTEWLRYSMPDSVVWHVASECEPADVECVLGRLRREGLITSSQERWVRVELGRIRARRLNHGHEAP